MDILVGKGTEHRQGLRTSTARGAGQPQGNVEVGTVEERLGQHPTSPVLISAQDLVKALAQRLPVREETHPHPNPRTPHTPNSKLNENPATQTTRLASRYITANHRHTRLQASGF